MFKIRKFLRRDIVSLVSSVLRRKFKRQVVAYLWPLVSQYLSKISRSKVKVAPFDFEPEEVLILVGSLNSSSSDRIPGIDLTNSLKNWIHSNMGSSEVEVLVSLESLLPNNSKRVIVVSYDWLITVDLWKSFFKEIRKIAKQANRLGAPVWIFPPDAFDLHFAVPTSLLVAKCGGSTVLQTNTGAEGNEFGLVFASGPHIWTMPPSVTADFSSESPWENRKRYILFAISSDPRRKALMELISNNLFESAWVTKYSNLELNWPEYVRLVKSCRIVMTTCLMYETHIVGSKITKRKIPATAVTHRVWEGFASGCTVFTNTNKVFDALGFKPGIHYVEIWDESTSIVDIRLPTDRELKLIAKNGHDLFSRIAKNSHLFR